MIDKKVVEEFIEQIADISKLICYSEDLYEIKGFNSAIQDKLISFHELYLSNYYRDGKK